MCEELRCSRLAVPVSKLSEFQPVGIFHRFEPVVGGDCLPIVSLKIKLHTFLEALFTENGVKHSNYFRTFLVNGDSVKIVNLDIGRRTNRMTHWTCIFRKLKGPELINIINTLDSA